MNNSPWVEKYRPKEFDNIVLNSNNKIFASVGPCIGKKSYEIDINFYEKFISKSGEATSMVLVVKPI